LCGTGLSGATLVPGLIRKHAPAAMAGDDDLAFDFEAALEPGDAPEQVGVGSGGQIAL
jgi:hypothetical protein